MTQQNTEQTYRGCRNEMEIRCLALHKQGRLELWEKMACMPTSDFSHVSARMGLNIQGLHFILSLSSLCLSLCLSSISVSVSLSFSFSLYVWLLKQIHFYILWFLCLFFSLFFYLQGCRMKPLLETKQMLAHLAVLGPSNLQNLKPKSNLSFSLRITQSFGHSIIATIRTKSMVYKGMTDDGPRPGWSQRWGTWD